ncbi:MAG: hypothetical protein JXB49_31840 [Bacteroidales bacterium]|nr:hypothetical protein [Bacteroidales bacterium]
MIRLVFSFCLFLTTFSFGISQGLEFYKEDLVFEVIKSNFVVEGAYYFCNTSADAVKQLIWYPFPEDSMLFGEIDSVSIFSGNVPVSFYTRKMSGVGFSIEIKPFESKCYNIYYSQQILGNKAEYILLTTQSWGKPLKSAKYKVLLPEDLQLDSLSYPYDTSYIHKNKQVFYWEQSDFLPDKNIIVEFHQTE